MKIRRIGFRRRRGSASLWTFFIAAVLISFSVLIYTGMIVRSKYLLATTEIERAANVALDANLINPMVRDIQLAVPLPVVENSFDPNLRDAGFSFLGDTEVVKIVVAKRQIFLLAC